MKVIIAGGRDFNDWGYLRRACMDTLKHAISTMEYEIVVISGKARGADTLGEKFAESQDMRVLSFPANWETHGKKAGFIRNEQMAEEGDMLIAFWDGKSKGTKHMIDLALKHELETHVYFY
ncbi:MAG: DUF2493 domain-containing protein [Vicingus serpentipes]|nr:DUF2493 domain-containing protein [Vicingus serpentipes]